MRRSPTLVLAVLAGLFLGGKVRAVATVADGQPVTRVRTVIGQPARWPSAFASLGGARATARGEVVFR